MKTTEKLTKILTNGKLIPVFEIKVKNKRTKEICYIIFDISVNGDKLIASHEPLTESEIKSDKVAFCECDIDNDFTATENLENLLDECNNIIIYSQFFELAE